MDAAQMDVARAQLEIAVLESESLRTIYQFVLDKIMDKADGFVNYFEQGGISSGAFNILMYYHECRQWIGTAPETFRQLFADACGNESPDSLFTEWDGWFGWDDDRNSCIIAWSVFDHIAHALSDDTYR